MLRSALLLVVVAACAPSLPPPVTATDAAKTSIPLADLQAGRTLVIKRCGGCHGAPAPAAHTASEWPKALDEMAGKANLSPAERASIQQYLIALSR